MVSMVIFWLLITMLSFGAASLIGRRWMDFQMVGSYKRLILVAATISTWNGFMLSSLLLLVLLTNMLGMLDGDPVIQFATSWSIFILSLLLAALITHNRIFCAYHKSQQSLDESGSV